MMSNFSYLTTTSLGWQDILTWAVIGVAAGMLAARTMYGTGLGIILESAVGIAGAVAGGFIAQTLGITVVITNVDPAANAYLARAGVAFAGSILVLCATRIVGNGRDLGARR